MGPLRRIREYVEIFDQLIAGEKLNYDGRLFNLKRGFTLDYIRPRSKIPVYIAAITAKSIRQTGEIADGIYFLCSDEARAITGISMPIDAGWLSRVTYVQHPGWPPTDWDPDQV